MLIQRLPENLKFNGFDYALVERTDYKAIYSQGHGDGIVAYEVFNTKVINNHQKILRLSKLTNTTPDLSKLPERVETFPRNEEFGVRAWTCRSLKEARDKYLEL